MKRMLCVLLALMLLLAGCGKEQTPTATTTQPTLNTAPPVTVPQWVNDTAVDTDSGPVSHAFLGYYYMDTLSGFYGQAAQTASSYAAYMGSTDINELITMLYGLDVTTPLSQQQMDEEQTWADFFVEGALSTIRRDAAMTMAAQEADFQLDEDSQNLLNSLEENIGKYASNYGYTDAEEYLRATYGSFAEMESYLAYYDYRIYADAFYQEKQAAFAAAQYGEQQLREWETGKEATLDSFSFCSVFVAETADQSVIEELTNTTDTLEVAAGQLSQQASVQNRVMYDSVPDLYREWLTASDRIEGEIASFPAAADAQTPGTYVVQFLKHYDNALPMANVRHLLVKFQTDSTGAQVEGTREACLSKANSLLDTWKNGEATEDSFIALVKEHSEDGNASTGGMYEAISPATNFVEPFLNWCIDENRQVGDVEIVETNYGFHIMYFSSFTEMTYRDQMITENLRAESWQDWYEASLERVTLGEADTSHLDLDVVLAES